MNLQDISNITKAIAGIGITTNHSKLIELLDKLKIKHEEIESYNEEFLRKEPLSINLLISLLKKHSLSTKTINELLKIQEDFLTITSRKYPSKDEEFKKYMEFINRVESQLPIWEDRIYSEIGEIIVTQPFLEGTLSPKKLLEGAYSFFEKPIWNKMNDIEKKDLQDFFTCYLHKAFTSAGIMAMRTIESAMRYYYAKITKGKVKKNWYKILKDLKDNYSSDVDSDLMNLLEYIRDNVRNPLAHPEKRIEESESLEADKCFLNAMEVLNKVYG